MHFFNSIFPVGCRYQCIHQCIKRVAFFKECFLTHARAHSFSWVTARMGQRSLGFTLVLLPLKAMQKPGAVPATHGSLRVPNVCPSQFRRPLLARPRFLAKPGQTMSGSPACICLFQGASCLHSFGLERHRQALGMIRTWVFGSLRWM